MGEHQCVAEAERKRVGDHVVRDVERTVPGAERRERGEREADPVPQPRGARHLGNDAESGGAVEREHGEAHRGVARATEHRVAEEDRHEVMRVAPAPVLPVPHHVVQAADPVEEAAREHRAREVVAEGKAEARRVPEREQQRAEEDRAARAGACVRGRGIPHAGLRNRAAAARSWAGTP